jgi:Tol biopolymer transport system component
LFLIGLVFAVRADKTVQANAPYDVGPVKEPRLFGEGVVSTEDDESGGTLSPDGTEFYFVKFNQFTTFPRYGLICVSHFRDGKWSQPEALPFSGRTLDFPPRLSPDGKIMYFSSARPAPGKTARVLRIWSVERTAGGWGEPQVLPAPINAPDDRWNLAPSVTRDGTLYFASTRGGDNSHIYRSRFQNGVYSEPEKLGPEVNSDFTESDPYISPDEKILIFSSAGDGLGDKDRDETLKGGGVLYARADLYISVNQGGKWSKARHLEHGINSVADESTPSITPDGKYLFFASERSPFTVPTAHPLNYDEIENMLHSTLNGHGNIFFVGREALDLGDSK